MSGVLIGIDAGTSGIKVGAFSRDGTLISKAHRPISIVTPLPRWAEIDLEHYWIAVTDALVEVLQASGPVGAVGFSTTCPTTVLLDREGNPLRPGIPYLDNRAVDDLTAIGEAAGGREAFFSLTGNRLSLSTCTAGTLRWIQREEAALWTHVASIGFLNTFLAARLTGRVAVDWTQASYSGLFSLTKANAWSTALIEMAGMPADILPPIVAPFAPIGTVTLQAAQVTGLPAGTPVAMGAADTAAASFALGIREAGAAFESVGTSGVITFCLGQPDFDKTFLNRCHILPGRWLAHGAMSTLGGALAWLRHRVWPELRSLAELEHLALESTPGANGLVFLPYLAGERSPIWDSHASGAWIGLRLDSTRADMVRSVFEGGAYALRQIVERAELRWNWRPESLLSVGGGTCSRTWHQIKADILGIAYLPATVPDASALGAAMLGGIAAGIFTGVDDPTLPKLVAEVDPIVPCPREQCAAYEKTFRVYDSLYPTLREAMHALA
ncbi:MAG: hypothetical protein KGZ60_05705 [Truepera sp.]|nr:hypothetical protein [Truepera sp.]